MNYPATISEPSRRTPVRGEFDVVVDVVARTIELEVPEDELAGRRARLAPLAAPAGCGWLSVYARSRARSGRARRSAADQCPGRSAQPAGAAGLVPR